jgi:hypothetical protein
MGEKGECFMANRPIHEIRLGTIKAVIWENPVQGGGQVRRNVVLERLYKKDDSKDWLVSNSFGRDDLLVVARVAQKAADWIFENSKSQSPAEASTTTPAAVASA